MHRVGDRLGESLDQVHVCAKGNAVKRVLLLVFILVALVSGDRLLESVSAQDTPPNDFSPFTEPVALPDGTLPGDIAVQLVKVAGGLIDPVNVTNAGDGSGRLFVVQ